MMIKQNRIDKYTKYLIVIIGLSFALRIWGIWNATSTDEYNEVFEALRVCSGNLNFERWFKRFYLYVLSIEYCVYYVVGFIANAFKSPNDFAISVIRDMDPLFIIGRVTSAIFGTSSVLMTYFSGKVLFNRKTGLLAALFLCFNIVNIELSHYARVDASLAFLTMSAFYFIACIFTSKDESRVKNYFFAGLLLGCAFQTKPQAIVLIVPFLYAHFNRYNIRNIAKHLIDKRLVVFCIAGLFGIIIGNPAVVFAPFKFIASFISLEHVYTKPLNEYQGNIGYIVYGQYFYKELGLILFCVSSICLVRSLLLRKKENILLFSFIIPFYLLLGASRYLVSFSYMIPLMPFLYIIVAYCLSEALNLQQNISNKRTLIFTGLITCMLVQPFVNVIKFERSITGQNTRILAKTWIENNIPFGSKILMDSGKTINSSAPLIAMNREAIDRISKERNNSISKGTLNDTTKMVDAKTLVYFDMLRKTIPKESYDITSTGFGLNVHSIDYYISEKYKYFVISESMKSARTESNFSLRRPEIAKFYSSIDRDPRVKLIKMICPTSFNFGDTFYIYKLRG